MLEMSKITYSEDSLIFREKVDQSADIPHFRKSSEILGPFKSSSEAIRSSCVRNRVKSYLPDVLFKADSNL